MAKVESFLDLYLILDWNQGQETFGFVHWTINM